MAAHQKTSSQLEHAMNELRRQNKKLTEELASAQEIFNQTTSQLALKNRREARTMLSVTPAEETKQRMLVNALNKLEQYKKDALFYREQLASHEHDQTFISELRENAEKQRRVVELEKEVAIRRNASKKREALPEDEDPQITLKEAQKEKKLQGYLMFVKELEAAHKVAAKKQQTTEDWLSSLNVKLARLTDELNSLPDDSSYKAVLKSRRAATTELKTAVKVKHFAVSKLRSREAELLKESQRLRRHEGKIRQELKRKDVDLEICRKTIQGLRRPNKSLSMYTSPYKMSSISSDFVNQRFSSFDESFLGARGPDYTDRDLLSQSVLE